jgi:ubiquitin-like modifier-activating enzyme ATG7
VARSLLAWGVQSLHLVDNGAVAFSNPIRQSLYTFEDCLGGGARKAEAAARALKAVCPSTEVDWSHLSIPMPGHPPLAGEEAQVREVCSTM